MADVELPNIEELENEKKDRFTKRIALVTAVYAVMLAITSLGGNNAMKEMLLAQQQASNNWAFYQSKVMREHLYRNQKTQFEAVLIEKGDSLKPAAKENYRKLLAATAEEESRFAAEKKDIEKEAKEQEKIRDKNMTKDPYFDYAEVLLQIAIVMASIAILANSGLVFSLSAVAATLGTLLMINGYLLLVRIPFFH